MRARSRELEEEVRARTYALEQRAIEIELQRQELEALYRADAELLSHLELDEVLQALVGAAVDIFHADKGSLMVWNAERDRLVTRVARGFSQTTMMDMSFEPGEGVAGRVALTGEPAIVPRAEAEQHATRSIIEAENIQSFMQVPINIGDEVFGVFSVDFIHPREFEKRQERLLVSLAQRAALAIENARLYEQAQELAVMHERSRLARELHDAVTQTLFSSSLIAEALPDLWELDQEEGRDLLSELRILSKGAQAEMRSLLLELRPSALIESSLRDLLQQLCEAFTGRKGIPVVLTLEGDCVLPREVHVTMYRVAQEALNNVVKHAQAKPVYLNLHCDPHESNHGGPVATMEIIDDGNGFDPDRLPADRMGLNNMRERAKTIGAEWGIESQPGKGTRVQIIWK